MTKPIDRGAGPAGLAGAAEGVLLCLSHIDVSTKVPVYFLYSILCALLLAWRIWARLSSDFVCKAYNVLRHMSLDLRLRWGRVVPGVVRL